MMSANGTSHPIYFPHPVIYLSAKEALPFKKIKPTPSYESSVFFFFPPHGAEQVIFAS